MKIEELSSQEDQNQRKGRRNDKEAQKEGVLNQLQKGRKIYKLEENVINEKANGLINLRIIIQI